MKRLLRKLSIDLVFNWWFQHKTSGMFWLSLCLLALPLAFFVHAYLINLAYNTPSFLGVQSLSKIKQIRHIQGEDNSPLPYYLSEESIPNLPYKVIYEKKSWLNIGLFQNDIQVQGSFISGGYDDFGISASQGDLSGLEYPNPNDSIHIAISHRFWLEHFNGQNVTGTTIQINNELAIIDAVMTSNFKGFRPNSAIDIIVPFAYLPRLITNTSLDNLPPDVISYIAKTPALSKRELASIVNYLKAQVLLFGDETLSISNAIGISFSEYEQVQARLTRLTQLFSVLFIFSFVAFLSYQVNDNEARQSEFELRFHIGATKHNIRLQLLIDNTLNFISLLIIMCLVMPLVSVLIKMIIPNVTPLGSLPFSHLLLFCFILFSTLFLMSWISFAFQHKFLISNLNRGSTASRGQKTQTYIILSIMITISCVSILKGAEVLTEQYTYYQKSRGYDAQNLYAVKFERPKFGDTFFASNLPKLLLDSLNDENQVDNVAITTMPFMLEQTVYKHLFTPTMQPLGGANTSNVLSSSVSPNFFDVSGIKIIKGTGLQWGNHRSVVISHNIYRHFFDGLPLSNVSLLGMNTDDEAINFQVVGVAEDVYLNNIDGNPERIVYQPIPAITGFESLLIRGTDNEEALIKKVQRSLQNIDTSLTNPSLVSVSKLIEEQEAPQLALLTMSLLVMLVLVTTTILFCLNGIHLLLHKSRRELALRLNIGALPYHLVISELYQYLIVSIPLFLLINSGLYQLLPSIFADTTNSIVTLGLLFSLSIMMITLVFYLGTQTIRKQAWSSLS